MGILKQAFWSYGRTKSFSSLAEPLSRIGFIGLGNMGSHMANNLIKAGHKLTIHDRNEKATEAFNTKGASIVKTPKEVADSSDVVVTMLPSNDAVIDVYLGAAGILSDSIVKPSLLIDASTVDPHTSRRVAAEASNCKITSHSRRIGSSSHPIFLDSPVSGGVIGAHDGTLTFMVGGLEEGYEFAKPILQVMGKRVIYCGKVGNGAAAKVCNNLALAITMVGVCEALALGQKLGISAHTLSDIFNTSSARCWSSDTYNPVPGVMKGVPASQNYNGGFSCKLMTKDLGLAINAAQSVQSSVHLGNIVYKMYESLCDEGKGNKDFSSIFQYKYLVGPERKGN